MKIFLKLTLIGLLCGYSILNFKLVAKTQIFPKVTDLELVVKQIASEITQPDQILVIFDIDDTLLESENFVGSVKWYNWQRGRKVYSPQAEAITIHSSQKYACIFSMLGTLFEMGMTQPTQIDTANIVQQLKMYDLLYLTARTTIYRAPTERELVKNKLSINDKHLIKDGNILHFMLNDGHRSAKVTYENGIAMSSGLNKGKVLKTLLEKLRKSYPVIYFVDDSLKNIDQMAQEWRGSDSLVKLFHYTRIDKSISQQDIDDSDKAKIYFEKFIAAAFPERLHKLNNQQCN